MENINEHIRKERERERDKNPYTKNECEKEA